MSAVYFDASMTDEQRRRELYAGGLFVCSASPASQAMVELAQQMLEEAFAPYDPRTVHNHLSPEQVAAILGTLKPRFVHHPECKALIRQLMVENGVDIERTYFDVPRMRSAYPSDFLSSGIAYAFHAHRDTWYSAPLNQINWWFPIYPIEAGNSMAFYPYYFDRPVKNNSEIYNYYEWNTKHRATAAQHVKTDTREQPKPQQEIEPPAICLLPKPGSVILFSGAQLHETVPNTTGLARYSIDFRTVNIDDAIAHRGAPNQDSRCTGTTMRDYLRASDLQHLPEDVIRTYDDGTETEQKILYFGDRLVADDARAGRA
jgi:hypothetical protein